MSLIRFIRFKSPTGTDIYIESSKITGCRELQSDQTYVFVAAGNQSEAWIVGESIIEVLGKIPNKDNQ